MMRFFALILFTMSLLGTAAAESERPVLVELFANQNCPACPKAHRTMRQINEERDDIFILTWTVNYWDYLGEPDPMALSIAKDRQMAYTDRLSLRAPYTPQSFYDGAKECPGTRKRDIRRNIGQRLKRQVQEAPQLSWDGDAVRVVGENEGALELVMVEYLAGEANYTNMVNPVTKLESLGLWTAEDDSFQVSCETNCAILLQEQDVGEIVDVLPLN